ncbi:MAG: alcohol dehydrogenase catalytic domain-containing protein [Candidatus Lokiarchaeota archaeon]|nr:alcohol dehydrogenase catalytic domain-containing protein [Candidatus Lokiarchaeota archaeon]
MTLITLNNKKLPEDMNAIVLEKPYNLVHKKIPIWPLESYKNSEDIILLKVKSCGVCGSDFRYYQGENPWSQHTLGHHIENKPNIVLGHEFSGKVVAVTSEKNKKWLGKRVVPICSKVCGSCYLCNTNRPNICPNTIHIGHGQGWRDLDYYPGAYAEYVPAWGSGCFEIPNEIAYQEAAMMDILAVCLHVFNQGEMKENLPVLLIGAGPAGNGIAQVARIEGSDKIIIIERSALAINIAKKNNFDNIIDSSKKSSKAIREQIMKLTNDHGVISVFDSVGTSWSLKLGLNVLEKGGTFVNMAVHDANITFNNMKLSGERKITTSSNFLLEEYIQALEWLGAHKFDVKPWLTKISLKEVPEIFKERVNKKNRKHFKIVINDFD